MQEKAINSQSKGNFENYCVSVVDSNLPFAYVFAIYLPYAWNT